MKLSRSFLYFFLLGTVTSCQSNRNCCDEVVCETVHRYGVALDPNDWSDRGQDGQVVSMRKDGVVVNRCYDSGILHGECTYTFPHRDVIQRKEVYDQGMLRQEYFHYSSGVPQMQTDFNGSDQKAVTVWYENGAPHCKEMHDNQNNLLNGEYFNIEQQVESRVESGNGFRIRRDGQGQLESVDTIQNGQMVLRTAYHSNGMPASVTPYANGVVEGERRTYLSGGEPSTIEAWQNNQQHGTTQIFEHGEKRAEMPFVNGRQHGVERRFRDDGATVAQEITWSRGQKHGPANSYMGSTTATDWYFSNRPVPNKATFDMLSNQ